MNNLNLIHRILEEQGVKSARVESTISSSQLYSMRAYKDEEDLKKETQYIMGRKLADFLVNHILDSADVVKYEDMEGLHYRAEVFMLPRQQMLDLITTAYSKGRTENVDPIQFFKN